MEPASKPGLSASRHHGGECGSCMHGTKSEAISTGTAHETFVGRLRRALWPPASPRFASWPVLSVALGVVLMIAVPSVPVHAMTFPVAHWQSSSPGAQGVDEAALDSAIQWLNTAVSGGTARTVVVRNGYIIWKGAGSAKTNPVYSVSKAITSTLCGLLVDKGNVSMSTPVADIDAALSRHYATVTLHDMASFTSGYDSKNHAAQNGAWVPAAPLFAPGDYFHYYDPAFTEFSVLLTLAGQRDLLEQLRDGMAEAIGMTVSDWTACTQTYRGYTVRHAGGHGGGVVCDALSLARFGHLILNRGNWDGTRVVSEEWVGRATSGKTPGLGVYPGASSLPEGTKAADQAGHYGYQWVSNENGYWPDAPAGTIGKSGFRENYLLILPEWNLVVARLGTTADDSFGLADWNGFFARLATGIDGVNVGGGRMAVCTTGGDRDANGMVDLHGRLMGGDARQAGWHMALRREGTCRYCLHQPSHGGTGGVPVIRSRRSAN